MKKRILELECMRKTEWDRPLLKILTFLVKVKGPLGQSFFFSLSFFFSFLVSGGSDRVGPVQTGSVGQTG